MVYNPENPRITYLLARHLQENLTVSEAEELKIWRQQSPANDALVKRLESAEDRTAAFQFLNNLDTGNAWANISRKIREDTVRRPLRSPFFSHRATWAAAVAILLLAGGMLTFFLGNRENSGLAISGDTRPYDPMTGAIRLTSGDLQVVELGKSVTDTVIQLKNETVTLKNNTISFVNTGPGSTSSESWHLLQTPVGRQLRVSLADGSHLWINSMSSVSFPAVFSTQNRIVKLEGEAFFDVANTGKTHPGKPATTFTVQSGPASVEVLGTRFNVNAYDGDPGIKTTLVEGVVQVHSSQKTKVLVPGEMAWADNGDLSVTKVDVLEMTAWKDRRFQFDNTPMSEVVKLLYRWYGVELVANTRIPDRHFTASISMDKSLPVFLKILETSGDVHFEFVGKKLRIKENKHSPL
ncbi:DUF4974 domain-containing protein [Ravibacter arvi]|uniref:DUF4974 domain-containing protein n=1 Tax=Ravibacter arvi TaxID=2051041 RepID=A0ABP8M363_9BACT